MIEKGFAMHVFHWTLVIAGPILILGTLALYIAIRSGRISPWIVPTGLAAGLIAVLSGYPVASWIYERSYVRQIEKFHPYLQISPPALELREGRHPLRVFCLGGSTTQYPDKSGRDWPGRVESLVRNAAPGRDVQFYNMGRQWYTTQHILYNFQTNLRPARPDVIIVMEAVNDLLINADFSYLSHSPFRGDYGNFHGPVNRIIRRKSLIEFSLDILGGMHSYRPREVVITGEFPGLRSYRRNMETLIDLAALDGTRVVLMTQPYLFKEEMTAEEFSALHMLNYEAVGPSKRWGVPTARMGMHRYNAELKTTAAARDIPVIDLEAIVPKSLEFFSDEVHYRDVTFDRIAPFIAGELVRQNILLPIRNESS